MAFAITQTCCNDASCVAVCPVNCIHPTPDEPDFGRTDTLYVDPATCIDCGACADACPVDAIFPVDALSAPLRGYAELNAAYYADRSTVDTHAPNFHAWGPPSFDRVLPSDFAPLDVAVVGTGPAGMYAVQDLLLHTNSRVTLMDRLPVAGGLVRFGVAPDHPSTKRIGEVFSRFHHHPRLRLRLGVEVGVDVSVSELAGRHDAVIYAVGAFNGRRLGIPGEDLPGSLAAATVVGWYNGHPDVSPGAVDLSAERVVVVGTGNVALDVARILTAEPESLAGTTIAPHALAALRSSKVREVVLLGRRGPESAAYTRPEFEALRHREAEVVVGGDVDWTATPPDGRRIVFRFHATPESIVGDTQVRAIRLTDGTEIPAGQVVRAVGHHGTPVPGLPFDETTGTIPNESGRVAAGTYVVGWIKRGATGGIGVNKSCAAETVTGLLDDAVAGRLKRRGRRGRGPRR
ncbi:FAD-dependent oxidoreductase [Actinophytocola oryzae]|uniref:ferredoxin--NADP(+) reductase n=1 Tax=Actinophytocola oryzae TaxID=502181 RepID=A0A4R7W6H3_9PSEU|nr:FAD-dependent oxidoreductase [Actinophytocola oryzae]TDV57277.1 ferredoxin--NADP+ reductase [Actinophytocola oryzae]